MDVFKDLGADCFLYCFSLERQWNMWIPGYGSDEIRPFKKACTTEAHKQVNNNRIWLIWENQNSYLCTYAYLCFGAIF